MFRVGFNMLPICNTMKAKDLPLYKLNIKLYHFSYFPEEDLEFWELSKSIDTLKVGGNSFNSFTGIYFASGFSSYKGQGTFLMTFFFFNLLVLEG